MEILLDAWNWLGRELIEYGWRHFIWIFIVILLNWLFRYRYKDIKAENKELKTELQKVDLKILTGKADTSILRSRIEEIATDRMGSVKKPVEYMILKIPGEEPFAVPGYILNQDDDGNKSDA